MTSPQELLILLKGEFSSLTIGFNEDHACNYATAQRYHDEWGQYGAGNNDARIKWVSEEERQKAIRETVYGLFNGTRTRQSVLIALAHRPSKPPQNTRYQCLTKKPSPS